MSTTVKLYPPSRKTSGIANSLPQLLQTPSGLALLELQGSFNLPQAQGSDASSNMDIGRLDFPDYNPDAEGSAWMKTVHLYVGRHQRLTGEVKKLPKALAIVRRRENQTVRGSGGSVTETGDNLEVVEVVKYKLLFSNRPEPVGTADALG